MSMSLIAILVSLAMMLTGAGGEGMPAQAARTAVLRNVVVSYNGEVQRLTPEAHIGVSSDGTNGLFDFGVDLDGQTLLPIQISAGENGLTALFEESGVAVNVTAAALEQISAMAGESMPEVENPELMQFITEEYLPAYMGLLQAASDEAFQKTMREKSRELLNNIVDRGEGVPGTAVIDDVSYDVLTYDYTIDGAQMGQLADALFATAPEMTAYADAMFKLYDMMPEETGLRDIDSYSDAMTKLGIDMRMDMHEQCTADDAVQLTDATMTIDLSKLPVAMPMEPLVAEGEDLEVMDGEEAVEAADIAPETTPEPVVLEPLVMQIHGAIVDDSNSASVSFDYEVQGVALAFSMDAAQEPTATSMEMDLTISQEGRKTTRVNAAFVQAANADDGGSSYGMSYGIVLRDTLQLDVNAYGDIAENGTSQNSVIVDGRTPEAGFGISFDLDIIDEVIEDKTSAVQPAYVIDDLSAEAMNALVTDQEFSALMMKVGGSMAVDANKLAADQSIKNLGTLLSGERLPIVVDDEPEEAYDYTYEVDGDGGFVIDGDEGIVIDGIDDGEGDYEPVEDDGELGFEAPELGWLPEGWSIGNVETDTAYDWMGVSVVDENGVECMYATFFQDVDGTLTNYIVNEKGALQQGRAVSVSDYGEGGLSATIREGGLYANLSFPSNAIEAETLGMIVAGIEF